MMARNREWSAVGSLVDAARAGSIDDVRRALVAGADINALGGFTALSAACSSNHFNVVQFLVSRGAGVNILDGYGRSPLCCAALSARNTVILEFLLQHGADPRNDSALLEVCGRSEAVYDSAQLLIQSGADLNFRLPNGTNALITASYAGHANIIELLLEHGINVNERNQEGRSSLHISCQEHGKIDVIETLLRFGAKIDLPDKFGKTALFDCSAARRAPLCQLLIHHSANVDATDHKGHTPLHAACERDFVDIAELLIRAGADINLRTHDGRVAFDMCSTDHRTFLEELALEQSFVLK